MIFFSPPVFSLFELEQLLRRYKRQPPTFLPCFNFLEIFFRGCTDLQKVFDFFDLNTLKKIFLRLLMIINLC
jgi:hypothetical protein